MKNQLNKPKRFGEMLDTAFQLCKNRFSEFFMITLIIIGPLYLLHAILTSLTGTNFFREVSSDDGWFDQLITTFNEAAGTETSTSEDLSEIMVNIPIIVLGPVAQAAVLIAVYRLKKDQSFTVGKVIKQAFSRFWSILGSSLIFGLIIFGMTVGAIIVVTIFGVISVIANAVVGVIMAIILLLGIGLVIAYLLSRWGFYLAFTVFEDAVPGLGKSWELTRAYAWKVLGMLLVFVLIFMFVNLGVEAILLPLLGESVLYSIILNLVSLVTTTIFAVGYAVVYFDLKLRHDGDDLKVLIEDYEADSNKS